MPAPQGPPPSLRANALDPKALEAQLLTERKKLVLVQEVGRALSSGIDLEALLELIMENITLLMEADRSTLYILSDDRTSLWSRLAQGDEAMKIQLKVGEGIAGWVVATGETLNIPDAYNDARFQPAFDKKTGYRTQTILCMPMHNHEGDTIGAVQVLNKRDGTFDAGDESLLGALASQAAIAIENTKLNESLVNKNIALSRAQRELEQRSREINVLYAIEREMHAAHDLDELLDRILKEAIAAVGAEAGSVALRSRTQGDLRFHTTAGEHEDRVIRQRIPMGVGIIGWVAARGEPALVNDPENDDRVAHAFADEVGARPRNLLCVPLILGDETVGALELMDKKEPTTREDGACKGFDEDDQRLLQLIAGQASRSIQLARAKMDRENENRLATIGQMMAGVMHDLKTPMTIVSWYAELMVELEASEKRREYTELIKRQFDLMNGMTREVLAFARGESRLLIRKVFLARFLDEVTSHLRHELAGKGIEITIEANYNGIAYFDEHKIMRVIHNLARNAAEAMPAGGRFCIRTNADEKHIHVELCDNGPGIPESILSRLFTPFATAGKKGGTGLGLAIVKKIVDDHEGVITCTSTPSEGTRFLIRLPRREDPQAG
ncbi:MAG: GAF domain-containing sensor histidine kinase [Rhodothermales bacterium]